VTDATAPDTATLVGLHVHPVKSCGGITLGDTLIGPFGLDYDREWMVVDPHGEFLSQRELPRLALVQPQFKGAEVVLRAPGMLALHLRMDTVVNATRVRVWDDVVKAFDMGALAAQWFTDYLGTAARLVRFDPDEQRLADPAWCGGVEAPAAFADGFPLLVASTASLADLNQRLQAAGEAPVTMARFRPNLVLDGLQPWDEDHIDTLEIDAPEGPVRLKLVKPCARCSIPDVDPATAATGTAVARQLAGFRSDPRVKGGVTFGMNAIVLEGHERTLRLGQVARLGWAV
jgi:uncharacterized protein